MASYLDKFLVRTALEDSTKLDLSCQHITTSDFMQLTPVYTKEMVPGEKIVIDQQTFTRLEPLSVPTFGRANFHNRAFFVPYRTVWKGWDAFITDTNHANANYQSGIPQNVPTISALELSLVFAMHAVAPGKGTATKGLFGDVYDLNTEPKDEDDNPIWDFKFEALGPSGQWPGRYIVLNDVGRQALKVMNSLGYKVNPSIVNNTGSYAMSALPLLSLLKIYLDWYWPSAYYGDLSMQALEGILTFDNTVDGSGPSITANQLNNILSLILYVAYDSDYFVSAFDNPDGPTVGGYSAVTMSSIANAQGSGNTTKQQIRVLPPGSNAINNGTPVITNGSDNNTVTLQNMNSLSQYALNALRSLTDYMKRHQLVGARAIDRFLARFGKQMPMQKLLRSNYIGASSFGIQIGDVMSLASTPGGSSLGDYAGKAVGYGDGHFEYDTDEYGMFFICSSIVPTVQYVQGIDRTILHKNKLDFWTPEFDQLGTQAILKGELFVDQKEGKVSNDTTGIFGFAPRYAEYKVGQDRLTGDFMVPHLNVAGDTSNAWHLSRLFDSYYSFNNSATNIVHTYSFVMGKDSDQYNRIFQLTSDEADHFRVIHNFNVVSYSPMHPLYDSYEFDSKGRDIKADVNGVKVN